ncbi:hypothetical protein ABT336_24520 [Micromonospora sp. NPDC000207]|uniref:hypothetical protein n=1 Tax=Micromonospora sp. NPDC000207 TaxID=3154246 RepID=UPI003319418F
MVIAGAPQGAPTVATPTRRAGTAATIGAVVAVVVLILLAVAVAGVAMFLPMAIANCGINDTDHLLACNVAGQVVLLVAPFGGAVLGPVVALAGFLPFLRRWRGLLVGAGYLIVLGGLGLAFLVAFGGF